MPDRKGKRKDLNIVFIGTITKFLNAITEHLDIR